MAAISGEAVVRLTDAQFEELVLSEPDQSWELWQSVLRRKPPRVFRHNDFSERLTFKLQLQLDWDQFRIRTDKAYVRRPNGNTFKPDFMVVPRFLFQKFYDDNIHLEVYDDPLPLIGEVVSRSTARYDQRTKLAEYRLRGDLEIWIVNPFTKTVTSWQRQPDGSYRETTYHGGTLQPVALPGVTIDLDEIFLQSP